MLTWTRVHWAIGIVLFIGTIYSFYELTYLKIVPYLSVFIAFMTSGFSFLLGTFVRLDKQLHRILFAVLIVSQLIIALLLTQNADLLKVHWRWLFYPAFGAIAIALMELANRKTHEKPLKILIAITLSVLVLHFVVQKGITFYLLISLFSATTLGLLFAKGKLKA